ncbi:hypothetical protein BH10PLA2_BH10PLA2_22900 [soil metagenome]
MRRAIVLAAVSEGATGLALLVVPSFVGRLLFGEELVGVTIPIARVLGIALIALGVACWPPGSPRVGMVTYSATVTVYFFYIGIRGERVGPLLWSAAAIHAALTASCVLDLFSRPND